MIAQRWPVHMLLSPFVVLYLLDISVDYVVTQKFNSNPVEALFDQMRTMPEGNNGLNLRAVTFALDNNMRQPRNNLPFMPFSQLCHEQLVF